MEEEGSILEAIFEEEEEDVLEEVEDVDMVDVEEGEIAEQKPRVDSDQNAGEVGMSEVAGNQASKSKNKRRKNKKKKKKNGGSDPEVTYITRFVEDTCRRLHERKSYMVYTAVSCLGISRLKDLVKEVDAIQYCGGQMTVDRRRPRTGGGILWNILKTKEPMAYQEIMKKAKEFEKQFKQQNKAPWKNKGPISQEVVLPSDVPPSSVQGGCQLELQNQQEESSTEQKNKSVHDRIRVPVSYDDLLGDDSKNDIAISEKLSN